MFSKAMNQIRNSRGQAVALPMVVIALTSILGVGLFSFEIGRTAIARDQLKAATDSAALAAAATLAGSSDSSIAASQVNAMITAHQMFSQNEIFGQRLSNTTFPTPVPNQNIDNPASGQAKLRIQFIDPATKQVVFLGDPRGKAIEVSSTFGLPSLAGKVIGMGDGPTAINARSNGGVGQLDVVLCFDCSTSMRFNTKLSVVRRSWDLAAERIKYTLVSNPDVAFQGGMEPQLLSSLNAGLRGRNDNSLPGNFPPGAAQDAGNTDVVVNFDEQTSFGGFSEGGFDFPNLAALVEASRGNLENEAVFQSSGAATTLAGVVTPQAGYKAKYFELARKHTHPWAEAEAAAKNFYTLMNNNTNAHFGFVAFSDQVGVDENTKINTLKVGPSYPQGGSALFPLPAISLNSEAAASNFESCTAALSQVVPNGNTNMGGSLERAQQMFSTSTNRPDAKKAIILFTDGEPTIGNPSPQQACLNAAQRCRQKGIAVFCVGLSNSDSNSGSQLAVLNSISGTAGNGGRVFQVQNVNNLNKAFSAIARSLSSIIQ